MATSKSKRRAFKLDAYNIRINTVDIQAFFGISNLPPPAVDPVILQNLLPDRDIVLKLPQDLRLFFVYLRNSIDKDQPSCIDDFTYHLLGRIFQFGLSCSRSTFPFIMNGRRFNVWHNLSVTTLENYQIILVQRDKVSVLPFMLQCIAEHQHRILETEQSLGWLPLL